MNNDKIVRYHNDLNGLSMRSWSAEDMNFFFSIIAKISDLGTKEVNFSTDEIRKTIGYDDRMNRWIKILDSIANKVSGLRFIERSNKQIAYFNLFQRFVVNLENHTINIRVSEDFEYVVNKLTANFTSYELVEFTALKSTYSKTMYRILKQWKTTGNKRFTLEQFKKILEIPESYTANNIDQRVIQPIQKELPQFFKNLKIKIIKTNTRGTPVVAYEFTWIPQKSDNQPYIANKYKNKKLKVTDDRMTHSEKKALVKSKQKNRTDWSNIYEDPIKSKKDIKKALKNQVDIDDIV